jgi:hypothetical protein
MMLSRKGSGDRNMPDGHELQPLNEIQLREVTEPSVDFYAGLEALDTFKMTPYVDETGNPRQNVENVLVTWRGEYRIGGRVLTVWLRSPFGKFGMGYYPSGLPEGIGQEKPAVKATFTISSGEVDVNAVAEKKTAEGFSERLYGIPEVERQGVIKSMARAFSILFPKMVQGEPEGDVQVRLVDMMETYMGGGDKTLSDAMKYITENGLKMVERLKS